ncbi:unnamed protein product [Urochloa decumbens]|uniref:TFIIS N-terminal domain-containing protein n=1 Tax=Urochloa decumbens TaxID=240449 RepID=A0ABC9BDW4_9POAL
MALRRLKPLLCAFEYIDAAIEAADAAPGSRDAFRSGRERIVEMVCDVAEDDEGGGEKAEALCTLLDEAMAGALATLREVPAEKIALEAGDLVGAVGELMREHPSQRVRGLAGDVARGWRAGVTAEVERARARAAMVLDGILATPPPPPPPLDDTAPAAGSEMKLKKKAPEEQPCPRKTAVVSTSYAKPPAPAHMRAPEVVPSQPKKTPPLAVCSVAEEEKKLQATKRKLHERYQEAEDAKRRRTIQVIKPPRPPPATTGQRQRNAHPGMRARVPASCAAERRFMKPSSLRMMI